MTKDVIFVEDNYLEQLARRETELYLEGINISLQQPGRVYEISHRELGRLEGFFIGEIHDAIIWGTVFEDPVKEELWRAFYAGELPWEELQRRGGSDGRDPRPEGNYLMKATGFTPKRDGIVGIPTRRYNLVSNEVSGDIYQMYLLLTTLPKEKIKSVITDPYEHDPLWWPVEASELAKPSEEGDLGVVVSHDKLYLHPRTIEALRERGAMSFKTVFDLVSYGQAFSESMAIALGWKKANAGALAYKRLKKLLAQYVPKERLERKPVSHSYGALP